MSKYIRTKDNSILKVYADRVTLVECEDGKVLILIHKEDIIKQADTIEELCDEFVVDMRMCETPFVSKDKCLHKLKELQEINKKHNQPITIYGAIWTDKGLIYKAKLNKESGVLEFL